MFFSMLQCLLDIIGLHKFLRCKPPSSQNVHFGQYPTFSSFNLNWIMLTEGRTQQWFSMNLKMRKKRGKLVFVQLMLHFITSWSQQQWGSKLVLLHFRTLRYIWYKKLYTGHILSVIHFIPLVLIWVAVMLELVYTETLFHRNTEQYTTTH